MKTPKRYPATMSVYLTSQDLKNDRARWKRKNKIKQLKRSLQRYKRIEHLPFYSPIWQACRYILDLKHPGKKATLNDWNKYMRELEEISVCILRESRRAGIRSGQLLEQQIRKEKSNGFCYKRAEKVTFFHFFEIFLAK